ncbi:hypothetical protein AX16_008490 [Volvariella volvacea WC 439]|nr:hypothetical protein AX16_008490 [Volvariella volvacea WC 439]
MLLPASLALLLSLFGATVAQDTSLSAVKQAFDKANIPTNLAINFNPQALLQVSLPQPSAREITLSAGVQLLRNQTAGPPTFSVTGAAQTGLGPFVIASVDPDAPTPQNPTNAQIRHFLGGNFFLSSDRGGLLSNSTPAISGYRQPTPPAGSDAHRYIFLLYKQPAGFNQQTIVTPSTSIAGFNISNFALRVGLGDPIGGTFMLVAPQTA